VPYYNECQVAMGCVISLADLSEITSLRSRLQDSYQELRATIDTAFLNQRHPTRVLVVDDNKVDRMAITSSFNKLSRKRANYIVVECDNFEEANQLLSEQMFDVCLLDYRLGAHTGFELVERLNNLANPPAFIVISSVIDETLADSAIKLGVYDMIDKKDLTPALLERSVRYTQRHKQTELYLSSRVIGADQGNVQVPEPEIDI